MKVDNGNEDFFVMVQKKGKRFINPNVGSLKRGFSHFLLWQLGYYDEKNLNGPPKDFRYPVSLEKVDFNRPKVMWISHSSFLIETQSFSILTDPVFSERCSPFSFFGPKRKKALSVNLDEIKNLRYVLISHNHYDHLDEDSVNRLNRRFSECIWIVPVGVKSWFTKRHIKNVYEFSWGDSSLFEDEVKITAVPSQHFSGRGLFDRNKTLWNGYVVELKNPEKKIYFVGDTGYNSIDFKKIGQIWKKIDLSLIPIGSYLPKKFMQAVHIDPQEAVLIHQEVNSQLSIGMHWDTFRLSDEPMEQPPYDLFLAVKEKKLDLRSFIVTKPGEYVNF